MRIGSMLLTKEYFTKGYKDWLKELIEYKYFISLSIMIFVIATFIDYYSGSYVTNKAQTEHVPDLILDHIRAVDLSVLYVYGYIILFTAILLFTIFFHVRTLHVVISQFSLLIMLRAVFTILTHLETPPDAIAVAFPWKFQVLSFQNDMFFSGHTAIPFLGFLMIKKPVRYFFLCGSFIMGAVVLLMHIHYSIDVFAAFFMTYGSYKIGNLFVRRAERYIRN
jgi:hypothetical protein